MALLDKLKSPGAQVVPPDIEAKVKRGRTRLNEVKAQREEAIEFTNGNHYVEVSEERFSRLLKIPTVSSLLGGGRPDHRVRRSHDLIGPIVNGKTSAATQRIPGYEVDAATTDPEDYSGAKLGEKVLIAGYERWRVKRAFQELAWYAYVTEEGFITAYWDASVGPFYDVSRHPLADEAPEVDEEGNEVPNPYADQPNPDKPEYIGAGDIRFGVYGGLEVVWEPGVKFEDSRWWAIEHARPVDVVSSEPDFMGGKLTPDATASAGVNKGRREDKGTNLVMVTEYLERPSPKHPEGRRLIFANKKLIFPEDAYPLRDENGEVVDEPCIYRLSYVLNPSSDRDKGLVCSLIESMRSYDFAVNKQAEFAQEGLVPQILAPEGSIISPRTDEPGAIVEYDPSIPGGAKPEFAPTLGIPGELFTMQDRAKAELGYVAHENEVPAQVQGEKAVLGLLERDQIADANFLENLAEVYARIGRDCLCLVQQHYDDQRLLKFRGRTGWLPIENFKASDIRGQTDVRVKAGSIEAQTRAGIEKRIMSIAERFPGYFSPEVILGALERGNAEGLLQGYEEDVARANLVIAQIRAGTFWKQPSRPVWPGEESQKLDPETGEPEWQTAPQYQPDPETGEQALVPGTGVPVMETEVPGWMPRPFDNVSVHKSVFELWLKGDEWNQLDDAAKQATMAYYDALLRIEARNAARQRELQSAMAEEAGMANAATAAAPAAKPMPSLPASPAAPGA